MKELDINDDELNVEQEFPPSDAGSLDGDNTAISKAIRDLEEEKEVSVNLEPVHRSRDEKKADRWKEHRERTAIAEREREEATRARMEAERRAELAEARARAYESQLREPKNSDLDPDAEINRLYDEQAQLVENFRLRSEKSAPTEDEHARFRQKAREINNSIVRALAKTQIESVARPQQNVGEEAIRFQLQVQYPEIFRDPNAQTFARGLFMQKTAMGMPNSLATIHEVMNATNRQYGYGQQEPPDEATKQRFSGPKAGTGGGKQRDQESTIKIDKPLMKIIRSSYPGLSDEDAAKKWVKINGKDYLESLRKKPA